MSVRAAVMLIGETKEFLVVGYGALFSVSARDLGSRERGLIDARSQEIVVEREVGCVFWLFIYFHLFSSIFCRGPHV